MSADVTLCLNGMEVDTQRPFSLKLPTSFLVAELGRMDAIVSYDWLTQNDFMVNGRRHGICHHGPNLGFMIFFPGIRTPPSQFAVSQVKAKQPLREGVSAKSSTHPKSYPYIPVPPGRLYTQVHPGHPHVQRCPDSPCIQGHPYTQRCPVRPHTQVTQYPVVPNVHYTRKFWIKIPRLSMIPDLILVVRHPYPVDTYA